MGHVEVAHVSHVLPDGRVLFDDVSFKVGDGITAAIVGPNGAGKTTLLGMIAGDIQPRSGVITATGGRGGRTGKRAVMCEELAVAGTTRPFGAEIWFGDRIAVLGGNGSGKSSFLRLLAGEGLEHEGTARLGARVVPGLFAQTHARPDLEGRTPAEILMTEHALLIGEAMAALARYELAGCGQQPFGTLSGGQQARLQILLLELAGATLLLLDEPTDNLDLPSAEALQLGLEAYQGTVLAVTHDRWFARSFDRFLVFGSDGTVRESPGPVWD